MLVVMHDGYIKLLSQSLFDLKTLRCLDILQIDASEGGGDRFDHLNEFFRIFFIYLNIEHIDTGKYFKQQPLSFHHRFACQSTDITQAQHGGTVGDDRHQITPGGVIISGLRVFFYFKAGFCHSGRVGEREIML